jgi:hypothetical protein
VALDPFPLAGFEALFKKCLTPALNMTALEDFTQEFFPFALIPTNSGLNHMHGIESEDYSQGLVGLKDYFQKPPSNWTSHSNGIQLYGTSSKVRNWLGSAGP